MLFLLILLGCSNAYLFLNDQNKWAEAAQDCDANLATITNVNENTDANTVCTATYCWIGLRKINSVWSWSDGSALDYGFSGSNPTIGAGPWDTDEPNAPGSSSCVIITSSGKWRDISCSLSRYGVCDDTSNPTKTPTKAPTKAPTSVPSQAPTIPTQAPTKTPTKAPTLVPSQAPTPPTKAPTKPPTKAPSKTPTKYPTKTPTKAPTKTPTITPTKAPTKTPTQPTKAPTKAPTQAPTNAPFGKYPNSGCSGSQTIKSYCGYSESECIAECSGDTGCISFEFDSNRNRCVTSSTCDFANGATTQCTDTDGNFNDLDFHLKNDEFVFYNMYGCSGRNEGGTTYPKSLSQCRADCKANTQCISFEWFPDHPSLGATCQLSYTCTHSLAVTQTGVTIYFYDYPGRQ